MRTRVGVGLPPPWPTSARCARIVRPRVARSGRRRNERCAVATAAIAEELPIAAGLNSGFSIRRYLPRDGRREPDHREVPAVHVRPELSTAPDTDMRLLPAESAIRARGIARGVDELDACP